MGAFGAQKGSQIGAHPEACFVYHKEPGLVLIQLPLKKASNRHVCSCSMATLPVHKHILPWCEPSGANDPVFKNTLRIWDSISGVGVASGAVHQSKFVVEFL